VVTATKPERRKLTFATLDDVVRDAESLLATGYEQAGNWDLAQVCGHLAEWVRYPLDGFPKAPLLLRPALWLMRNTIGPRELRKVLDSGTMPTGMTTLKPSVPPPGGDPAAAVANLKAIVARFATAEGPFHPSPLLGLLTKDQLTKVHTIHGAHHLSFLVPRS